MSNVFYANIINPNLLQSTELDPPANPMTSNFDMGNNEIINLAQGTTQNSAVTLGQVNQLIASIPSGGSGSAFDGDATFDINMNDNDLLNVKHLHLASSGSTSVQVSADVNGNVLLENAKVITSDNIASYIPAGGFTGNATFDINMNSYKILNASDVISSADFHGLGVQFPSSRVCNDSDQNLVVTRDGGVTIGKIYDSHYNPPPTSGTGFTGNATFDINMNDNNLLNVKQIDFSDGSSNTLRIVNNDLVYNNNKLLTTLDTTTVEETMNLITNVFQNSVLFDSTVPLHMNNSIVTIENGIYISGNNIMTPSTITGSGTMVFHYPVSNNTAVIIDGLIGATGNCAINFSTSLSDAVAGNHIYSLVFQYNSGSGTNIDYLTACWGNSSLLDGNIFNGSSTSFQVQYSNNTFSTLANGTFQPSFTISGITNNDLHLFVSFQATANATFTNARITALNSSSQIARYQSALTPNISDSYDFQLSLQLLDDIDLQLPSNLPTECQLDIYIYDANNRNCLPNTMPAWSFKNSAFKYNADLLSLQLSYISDPFDPAITDVVDNFNSQFTTGVAPYTYSVCFKNNGLNIVANDFSGIITAESIGPSIYTVPVLSYYDVGASASTIQLGQHNEPDLTCYPDSENNFHLAFNKNPILVLTDRTVNLYEYNATNNLSSAGQSLGTVSGTTYSETLVCTATTTDKSIALNYDMFNTSQSYTFTCAINILDGANNPPAFGNQDVTDLQIFIYDSLGNNLLNQDISAFEVHDDIGFSYNATTSVLNFNYTFTPTTVNTSDIMTNFYTTPFQNSSVSGGSLYHFQFKVLSSIFNSNTADYYFPTCNYAVGTVTVQETGLSYNVPVVSKYNATNQTTSVILGENQEPLLQVNQTDMYFNNNKVVCAPHLNIGTISRRFTASPSTPDNFFIPVKPNSTGYVKIIITGHTTNYVGWGTYEITGYYNNGIAPAGYAGESLPYVTANSGQIIHGADSNGDTNSCVILSSALSMSTVNSNQLSVMVALHSTNVVYTAKYEIIDCIGI